MDQPALRYDGRINQLYGIFVVNLLLTVITFGIYRFWAMTRWRRYFWSHMAFQGERFEYTGRGSELLHGFIMALGILLGLGLAAGIVGLILEQIHPALAAVPTFVLSMVIFTLGEAARFSALRYRLSRTLWCGIRGGMHGSALAYGVRSVRYKLILPFTLFQLLPWAQVRLAEHRINASQLGSASFSFQGRARMLYLPYLATLIGVGALFAAIAGGVWAIIGPWMAPYFGHASDPRAAMAMQRALPFIVLGVLAFSAGASVIACFYWALFTRHVIGNTSFGGLKLHSTVTGRGMLWLLVGNGLIALLTLGLGLPFVLHRSMRFMSRNLLIAGTLDSASLRQTTLEAPRTGEGMLQLLDAGSVL
jgi:uncharacterized membrane protein YjgN (DUF898 family)